MNTTATLGTTVLTKSTSPGSFFAPSENAIHLNNSLDAGTAANVFVHEAFHAWSSRTQHTADINALSRAEYITAMIDEETNAVVNQIALVIEQGQTSGPGGIPSDAMFRAYQQAWQAAFGAGAGAGPGTGGGSGSGPGASGSADPSDAGAGPVAGVDQSAGSGAGSGSGSGGDDANKAAADAAARLVVVGWFSDGTFVTSTTNQPYADYYGIAWDGVHKPPAQ